MQSDILGGLSKWSVPFVLAVAALLALGTLNNELGGLAGSTILLKVRQAPRAPNG